MYPRQNTVATTDCLTPSTRANMTDWHPHRPWLFPAGKCTVVGCKGENITDAVRNLSLFTYMEFSFHHIMIDNQNFQMSLYCAGSSYEDGIIEEDLFYEEKGISILPPTSHRTAMTASERNSWESMVPKIIRQAWREELWKVPQNLVAITAAACRRTSNYSPAKKPVL